MKILSTVILLFLSPYALSHSENLIHLDIESFDFDKDKAEDKQNTFRARRLTVNTPIQQIDVAAEAEAGWIEGEPKKNLLSGELVDLGEFLGIKASLEIDGYSKKKINFLNYKRHKDEIPFYYDINFLYANDFTFIQDHHKATIDFESLHTSMFGFELVYHRMQGECKNRFDGEIDLVDACLNNASFLPKLELEGEFPLNEKALLQSEKFGVQFQLDHAYLNETTMQVKASDIQARFGSMLISADGLEMDCYKSIFNEKISDVEIVKNCLMEGEVKVPSLEIINDDLKLLGEVDIKEFTSDDESIRFETGEMNYKFETSHIYAQTIKAHCATAILDINFEYMDVPYACLKESGFNMTGFFFQTIDMKTAMETLSFDVTDSTVDLNSPQIVVDMHAGDPILDPEKKERLKVTVNQAKISCDKTAMDEASFDSVLKGCFDSSSIDVASVEVEHPAIDSSISINSISIDNDRLKFYSPKGSYTMDEDINHYEALDFECDLNANFDNTINRESLQDTILSWKKLLTNCIHNSVIDLDSLKSSFNGTHIGEALWSTGTGFLFQAVSNFKFKSKGYSGDIYFGELEPIFVKLWRPLFKFNGRINFDDVKNQIIIKVDKVEYELPWGIRHAFDFFGGDKEAGVTNIIIWMLDRFLEDETTDVNEKNHTITIQLPEDEPETVITTPANP